MENTAAISNLILQQYPNAKLISKYLLKYRPFICPFEEIIDYIPLNRKILDVGCGVGIMSTLIYSKKKPKKIVAFDSNERAIKLAKQSALGNNIEYLYIPKERKWPDGKFDIVVCIDVIHHVEVKQQVVFIENLIKKLNPNGILILKEMSSKPLLQSFLNRLHDLVFARQFINYIQPDTIAGVMASKGLKLVKTEKYRRLFYCHYLIIGKKEK
jgi:2-polyprenyl-3-methyl-5-hydroxy-6-metoxy-1,4-benzoquinol methylase